MREGTGYAVFARFAPVLFISTAACHNDLSRDEALPIILAEVARSEDHVAGMRVSGSALNALVEKGAIILAPPKWCGLGNCRQMSAAASIEPFVSKVDGGMWGPQEVSVALMYLNTPLPPTDVQITGIAPSSDGKSATVEFSYGYALPDALANLAQPAGPTDFRDIDYARPVLERRGRRWLLQRYDDGWRVAEK